MNNMKFKVWVWPLLLCTVMTAASITYWFLFGDGKITLAILINMLAVVFCGLGLSRGFKLGFTQKQTNND